MRRDGATSETRRGQGGTGEIAGTTGGMENKTERVRHEEWQDEETARQAER